MDGPLSESVMKVNPFKHVLGIELPLWYVTKWPNKVIFSYFNSFFSYKNWMFLCIFNLV